MQNHWCDPLKALCPHMHTLTQADETRALPHTAQPEAPSGRVLTRALLYCIFVMQQ